MNLGPSVNCNADIGMRNCDQISASSSLPDFLPELSWPFFNGWCPQMNDPQPYLKVCVNFYTAGCLSCLEIVQINILLEDVSSVIDGSQYLVINDV